eukprot:1961107-Ditylum_brightwellii.AAC.1
MVIATQHWSGWGTALIAWGCISILIVEDAEWSAANKNGQCNHSRRQTNKQNIVNGKISCIQGMRLGEGDTGGWMEKQDGWETYYKKDGEGAVTGWNSPM